MNLRLLPLFILSFAVCFSQDNEGNSKKYTLDINQYYGSILLHNTDISHLISNHPAGLIFAINRKTYGDEEWQEEFNYPDFGGSFVYQNMNNSTLGHNFGLYAHYNFYLFKRFMQFRLGQGIT